MKKFILNYLISLILILLIPIILPTYLNTSTVSWIKYGSISIGIILIVSIIKIVFDDGGAVQDGRYRTGYKDNNTPNIGGDFDYEIDLLFLYIGLSLTLIGLGFIYLEQFKSIRMLYSYITDTPINKFNYFFYFILTLNILNGFWAPFGSLLKF